VTIEFCVNQRRRQVPAELVERFRSLPVANISDSMSRMTAAGPRLRPLHAGGVLCGPAITVKTRPGDNLMLHMALNCAAAGDVIVVDAGGDLTNAITGERMLAYCVAKKFGGVVINGAVRDYGWIRSQAFPVFAAGVTHRGPYKDGPGSINVPIALDGMVIEPGDLIVGDEDGLVCVPFAQAASIVELAAAKHKSESDTFASIGKADNNKSAYVKKLRELGCVFEEGMA